MDCIINGSPLIEYFKSNGLPEKVYIYIYMMKLPKMYFAVARATEEVLIVFDDCGFTNSVG